MPTKAQQMFSIDFAGTLEKLKFSGSGGSLVARLKLKGIDGRAHKEWSLRLNSTQHGKTYQVQRREGLTDCRSFLIASLVVHGRS